MGLIPRYVSVSGRQDDYIRRRAEEWGVSYPEALRRVLDGLLDEHREQREQLNYSDRKGE